MADHFEKAKDDILRRTAGNGGPTPTDLLLAIQGLADDQDVQHEESMEEIKKNRELLEAHFVEADQRDREIAELQAWRREASEKCLERITAIVEQAWDDKHAPKHEEHIAQFHALSPKRREGDELGENHREERNGFPQGDQRTLFEMLLGWSIVKWLITLIIGAMLVWGVSYWASACAAEKVEKEAIGTIEQHYSPAP